MVSNVETSTRLRQARDEFLSSGSVDDGLISGTVRDSWQRSRDLRVHPDRVDLPFVREPDLDSPLVVAASPVVHRLGEDLAAQSVSIILTSADGLVLDRAAADARIRAVLDSVQLACGYSYAEKFVGTNGIGTTAETGRATFIRGGEHYLGTLGRLACAGAPIRDPLSGRVAGILDLTCWARQSDPLLVTLAKTAGSQIEDRLRALATESEAALLDTYLRQCRRYPTGVLAVGDDIVLMNRYLRESLDGLDQSALLGHATDLQRSQSTTAGAVLPSGYLAKLTVAERITLRSGRTHIVAHVALTDSALSRTRLVARSAVVPGLAGGSSSWRRSCQQVERCCADRDWVVLDGESGSGRTKLAEVVAHHVRPDRTVRVLRFDLSRGAEEMLNALEAEVARDDFDIVLTDIDELPEDVLESVSTVLQACAGRGWIAATMNSTVPSPAVETQLLPLFMHTVPVPALRHHIEDLDELVPDLLRELTKGADITMSPAALRRLAKLSWPGNIAQLRQVLAEIVIWQRSGVITPDKLPPECHSLTRRTLTPMEALERDAIVRSLHDHDGDKRSAAADLGISRATMYRRIRQYGIT
ncbi:GAF domain-containing protein [Nocardia sp. CA2R105]|uniref:sigma-54-dependent Fis family transcriptional regulator n=1 Tax=Nocardia coffeae TaxID=2873381 RepID=UPI001CA71241|nr:GAF domain-containing protein [Nocardia coffeae]MBY8862200.1 GAF domain-containing protein [Nocardia coffeae]